MKRICQYCKKQFDVKPSVIKKGYGKTCSLKCRGLLKRKKSINSRQVDKDGYILVFKPNHPHKDARNCVREHRLVIEKYLGRYLRSKEVVHHVDGNKQNNDIANLMVFTNNGEHLKFERKGIKLTKQQLKNRILKTWSRKYDKCRKCGTIKNKHKANGLCVNCYNLERYYDARKNFRRTIKR